MEGARGNYHHFHVRTSSDSWSGIARRLLKSLSIKQGVKYDSPESAREIPAFIEFHRLNVEELLDPLDSFSKEKFQSLEIYLTSINS